MHSDHVIGGEAAVQGRAKRLPTASRRPRLRCTGACSPPAAHDERSVRARHLGPAGERCGRPNCLTLTREQECYTGHSDAQRPLLHRISAPSALRPAAGGSAPPQGRAAAHCCQRAISARAPRGVRQFDTALSFASQLREPGTADAAARACPLLLAAAHVGRSSPERTRNCVPRSGSGTHLSQTLCCRRLSPSPSTDRTRRRRGSDDGIAWARTRAQQAGLATRIKGT